MLHWCIFDPAHPRRARRALPSVALAFALTAAAACGAASPGSDAATTPPPSPGGPPTGAGTVATAPPGSGLASTTTAGPGGSTPPSTSAPPAWTATTEASRPPEPRPAPCPEGAGAHDRTTGPATASSAATAVATAMSELRRSGGIVSVAVSEVGASMSAPPSAVVTVTPLAVLDAERKTVPASNQKLLVAAAALEAEGPDATFETEVVATGPTVDGVVHGDLVLVGGGDPSLTRSAAPPLVAGSVPPGSLDGLVQQVRARGITQVLGRVLVDERRFDQVRFGPGGAGGNVGPMSALVVDRNRSFDTPSFATDPALSHAGAFAALLQAAGVGGPAIADVGYVPPAPTGAPSATVLPVAGERLAAVSSPPLRDLVAVMLSRSDNMYAEVLTKDIGFRTGGFRPGTTAGGLLASRRIVAGLCVTLDGTDSDGSGLSLANRRTAGGIQRLLEVAMTRPWWPHLRDGLAVAGRTGTLTTRMANGPAAGRVHAKSGSVGHARSLSGYVPTAGGRTLVFSVLVDNATTGTEAAVDAFVDALAR